MEFFGLQKDALLLHIKRVRTADGEPIFEENIFVPFDAYRELLTADLEDKSIFAEVERVGGTPIVSVGYRTVEAVRANAEQAAELGTRKVIAEHSTLGIVVTTDGSVADIPRAAYEEPEARVIGELKRLGKPFVVVVNTQDAKRDRRTRSAPVSGPNTACRR